jgi:3-phenylpropionate/trans-cinnamate dioxygenase ferredoxin reductase subunit
VVAVVGGGFIGLEVAASAAFLGARAIVLEAGPQILMRAVPGNMATIIRREHEAAGVRIETGVRPAAVRTVGNDVHLVLSNKRTLAADLVVIGIGATPNSDLAAQAGLRIDNGIAVDETLATSDPDIFAAGDCCSFPHALYAGRRLRLEAWRNARRQGTHAAANMLGVTESYCDVPWFWSDQYDKTLQVAGICNPEVIQPSLGESAQASVHLDSEGRLVAACAFGRLDAVAKEIRFAEKAIAKRVKPDIALISQPDFSFRLLR